jgi:hypothetical protein
MDQSSREQVYEWMVIHRSFSGFDDKIISTSCLGISPQ